MDESLDFVAEGFALVLAVRDFFFLVGNEIVEFVDGFLQACDFLHEFLDLGLQNLGFILSVGYLLLFISNEAVQGLDGLLKFCYSC